MFEVISLIFKSIKMLCLFDSDLYEIIMNKVIHVSEYVHELARKHCKANGLHMKDWVGELLLHHLLNEPLPKSGATPVQGNKEPVKYDSTGGSDEPKLWEAKPFWEQRKESSAAAHRIEEEEAERKRKEDKRKDRLARRHKVIGGGNGEPEATTVVASEPVPGAEQALQGSGESEPRREGSSEGENPEPSTRAVD